MIKVELETEKTKETGYPCIMKSKETRLIVLFVTKEAGTVLHPNENHGIGEYCKYWKGDFFEPYNKKVVLYND